MQSKTVSELAEMIGATVLGNPRLVIQGVAPIQNATKEEMTFLERADRPKLLNKCKAGAVIVPEGFQIDGFTLLQVPNVLESFEKIVLFFSPPREEGIFGISERAFVHPSAKIGQNVAIGHFAVIEEDVELADGVTIHAGAQVRAGCRIGPNTTIFANAVLYRNTVVGANGIIHSGAVIGAFGFGYDSSQGKHVLCPQMGNVVIGDNVEIGSCSTIDRATYGSTIIGDGTKIDNLVMIAHNCKLGRFNLICAHTGIAGSTTTGDYVVMAGRVGVRDHVHIGEKAVLGAMAGVMADVPEGARIVGIPATPEKEQMKLQVSLSRLPELRKEFKALAQKVEKLIQEKTAQE